MKYNNKKHIEKFRTNRITMDDVLDNACSINAPSGYHNYIGPWPNDPYNRFGHDPDNSRCSRYECPRENCYVLEKDTLNMSNPYAYRYTLDPNDRQNWLSNVDENGNVSGYCETKHNTDSNVYCEPNMFTTCPYLNQRVYSFDSDDNIWKNKMVNYFRDSNGECYLRDTNAPYDIVKILNKDQVLLHGEEETAQIYYDQKGANCRLQRDGDKFYNGLDEIVDLNEGRFESYNTFTNRFQCTNGESKEYGYSNTPGQIDGFTCGWVDDTECGSCPQRKATPCYVFDSNNREFEKRHFLQAFYASGADASIKQCGSYLVDSNQTIQTNFDGLATHRGELSRELNDDELRHYIHDIDTDTAPFVITEQQYKIDNDCKTGIDQNQCSDYGVSEWEVLGNNLPDSVFTQLERPMQTALRPEKYRFMTARSIRRWNSNGSECEYCYIDNTNDIIEDTCQSNVFTHSPTNECPKGLEYVPKRGLDDPYCRFCEETEFYDSNDSNCKRLIGCMEGEYFDPFDTSENFKIYNFQTGNDILDNSSGTLNKDNYANFNYAYLQNNSNATDGITNCVNCPVNEYINNDDFVNNQNIKFECNTCDRIDAYNNVYTVINNECSRCVKEGIEIHGTIPKYVHYDSDTNNRTCSNCPALSDSQYSGQEVIAETPISDGTTFVSGTCYRKCETGRGNGGVRITNNTRKAYTNGAYPSCDIECRDHYKIVGNTCEICPVGTENYDHTAIACSPCPAGEYNDVQGDNCKPCPNGGQSPTGSSSINNCYQVCANDPDNTQKNWNNGYDMSTCPKQDCHRGYNRESLGSGGYKISQVQGERNPNDALAGCEAKTGEDPVTPGVDNTCPTSPYVTFVEPFTTIEQSTVEPSTVESFTTVEPFSDLYCCPADMKLNDTNDACECEDIDFYKSNRDNEETKHVSAYSYSSAQNRCVPGVCVDGATLDDERCHMNCSTNQYINVETSTCVDCPIPAESSAETMISDGEGVDSCEIATCSSGYEMIRSYGSPPSCNEITAPCRNIFEKDEYPWNQTYYDIVPINSNANSIKRKNDEVIPTYHNKLSPVLLSPSACTTRLTESSTNPSQTHCPADSTNVRSAAVTMCCSSGALTETQLSDYNYYALCCPESESTKGVIEGGVTYLGCCSPENSLYTYVDSDSVTQSTCCPQSTPSQIYHAETDGSCGFTCPGGRSNADGTCESLSDCPPVYTQYMYDGNPYVYNKGYTIFELTDSSQVVEGTTCPSGALLDSHGMDHWVREQRCIFDDTNNEYKCCANEEAIIHRTLVDQTDGTSGINIDGTVFNIYIGTGGQSSPGDYEYICTSNCPSYSTYPPLVEISDTLIQPVDNLSEPAVYNGAGYECPADDTSFVCPEGTERIDLDNGIRCNTLSIKTCYSNITNPGDSDSDNYNAQWYRTSSNIETSLSCSDYFDNSDWIDEIEDCSRGSNEYDSSNIACCKEDSLDNNYYFVSGNNYCSNLVCGANQIINTTPNTPVCECVESWSNDTTNTNTDNVTKFVKSTPATSCVSKSNALPADHENSCLNSWDSDENLNYCCPGLSKKPYKIAEGIYTCSNVWTSNIKPQGFSGYDETAEVYHKINFDLAKEIESYPASPTTS